jgi:DNA-binding transcriptional ArsR family regulator
MVAYLLGMDAVFHALSDPSRRRMIDRLRPGAALSLTNLGEGLPITRQAVAKHVAVLEGAGLLRSVRRGRERLHALTPAPLDAAAAWIDERRALWAGALDALDAALNAADPKGPDHA